MQLVGQYPGSSTEKTKAKIVEVRGGVLFVDKANRLIPTAGKDFGSHQRTGDPVMIFAGYEKLIEKFFNMNLGLRSHI